MSHGVSGMIAVHGSYSGGWTCHRCKAWVPNGCTHHCPSTAIYPNAPPQPQAVALDPVPSYMRIAAALERIAKALEDLSATESEET